jgi:tetratricopeptide (TPR) repeat protein
MTFGLELALAGALLVPAQQPTSTSAPPPPQPRRDNSALYEDIEIMRQLLARKLAGFGGGDSRPHFGQNAWLRYNGQPQSTLDATANMFLGAMNPQAHPAISAAYADAVNKYVYTSPSAAHVEGVYLDRAGVVFTTTLPLPAGDPRPSPPKAAAPAADEWERTRKELRGEKSDLSALTPSQPPTVGDVVLRALAENGKHFRRLEGDERLTVVVTLHGHRQAPTKAMAAGNQPAPSVTPNTVQNVFTLSGQGGTTLGTVALGSSSVRDLELLADLHLKQQQYDQALEALRRVIAAVENEGKASQDAADGRKTAQQLSDLLNKQAQALLATGKADEARHALEKAAKLLQDASGVNVAFANKAKPEVASLPAKLNISAPKNLLDAVGSGKIDYEAFRQQVSVEYLTFGEEKSKSKP